MALYAGLAALVAAVPMLWIGVSRARGVQTTHREAVRYLGEDGFVPVPQSRGGLGDRVLVGIGRRLTPSGYTSALRSRLARAHSRRSPEQVLAAKGLGAVVGVGVGIVAATGAPVTGMLLGAVVGMAGFFLPDLRLRRRIDSRSTAIRRALPDALDLMAISVEAGVGLEGAMARAAEDIGGPLGEEFRWVLHDVQLGASRRDAFQALRERVEVSELSGFVLALLQADALGVAVGNVLKTQADEMRRKRRQRAREQAAKTPVKILFPLIFGIFPALLIVILGPAMIRILATVLSG
ncbi:MAG: type II secretion system F family protein [Actinomycetota bacterium]